MTKEVNSGENESLIQLAQQYARDIVSGVITPYDGGRRIWWECQLKLAGDDHRLDPFVYWASEYEETVDQARRKLCDQALKECR